MRSRFFIPLMAAGLGLLGCSSDGSSSGLGGAAGGGGAAGATTVPLSAVLVRGTLAGTDLTKSKQDHDALAAAGEAPAKAAGDIAHDVLLGTKLLGTQENQFMALDRWSKPDNIDAFYGNPDFQKGFGALFSAPPVLEVFTHAEKWHGWGDLDAADASSQRWFVVVRGRLAKVPAEAQGDHDPLAQAGEAPAKQAGDVAHVVFLGREDDREFLAIDVWTDSSGIEGFYGDPNFQKGFAALFEAAPTLGVYQSTDWHQW